jgi:hypothetical protein
MATVEDVKRYAQHEAKELTTALSKKEDLVLVVLRFHLLSENLIERIILAKLTRGDRLIERGRLSFIQKLFLLDSFDILSDGIIQSLKHLNTLRNACAHEKGKGIGPADVEKVGRPLGKPFTRIRREHLADLPRLVTEVFSLIFEPMLVKLAQLEFNENEGSDKTKET